MNEKPKLPPMMFPSEQVMALPGSQEPELARDMESETSFWNKPFGKLIRWLAFIPVGCVLGSILQILPPLGVELARSYKPEFNFLTILIAVFAVSIGTTVVWFWGAGVFLTAVLSCRIIAPNHRVGSVIGGTLFSGYQGINIVWLFGLVLYGQASWVFIAYQLVFSAIFIFGIVTAYNEDA
jgi:hypothetical protein